MELSAIRCAMNPTILELQKQVDELEEATLRGDEKAAVSRHVLIGAITMLKTRIIEIEQNEEYERRREIEEAMDDVDFDEFTSRVNDAIDDIRGEMMMDAKDTVEYVLESEHGWDYDKRDHFMTDIEDAIDSRFSDELSLAVNL